MKLRQNKPLRNLGIYVLGDNTLILVKRSEHLSFLFTEENWNFRGPVDFRVSHGGIYNHGQPTPWTDEDLLDTGMTASSPGLSSLLDGQKFDRLARSGLRTAGYSSPLTQFPQKS